MRSGTISRPRSLSRRRALAGAIPIAILALSLVACSCAPAEASNGFRDKVVVLVVDRVGMQDFPTAKDTPFLYALARRWSVGMMVTHTAERENGKELDLGADYVTLGAGVRSKGTKFPQDAGLAFNSGEKPAGRGDGRTAGELYSSYTGRRAPPLGVVCLAFPDVLRNNVSVGNKGAPGLMGRRLRDAGKRTAVVGNTDSIRRTVRLAPLICCDDTGAVPAGDVSDDTQVLSPRSPGGYVASGTRLLKESERLLASADMLVVDTGDTGRADREYPAIADDVLARDRAEALRRVDRLAEQLVSKLDLSSSAVLVVSPGAPAAARLDADYLTPFVAAGRGFSRGLLTSPSARRPGLVNNVDLLPTVLQFYGLGTPTAVVGAPMTTSPHGGDSVAYLRKLDAQLGVTRKTRWPIVVGYFVLAAAELCLALLCVPAVNERLNFPRDTHRVARFARVAAVVLMAGPLSFLVVSAFHYTGYVFPLFFCLGFTILVGFGAWLLQRGRPRIDPFAVVCLLTAAIMIVDLFAGGRLFIIPLLGVSALEGMRLYGLSNTLVGLLLGVSFWGVTGLAGDRALEPGPARWAVLASLLAVAFVVGFGALGANMGSFIVALAAALIFWFATSKRGISGWRAACIAAVTAATTAVMIVIDGTFVHTHAGKLVSEGPGRFAPLVQRKLMTTLGQIKFMLVPSLILIAAVFAIALWMKNPQSFWRRRWEEERLQTATLFSLVLGSLIVMVFEDTGVAMLGTMTLVSALAMSYYLAAEASMGPSTPAG